MRNVGSGMFDDDLEADELRSGRIGITTTNKSMRKQVGALARRKVEFFEHSPDVVVLDRGRQLRLQTTAAALSLLEAHGVAVVRDETSAAIDEYNRLAGPGSGDSWKARARQSGGSSNEAARQTEIGDICDTKQLKRIKRRAATIRNAIRGRTVLSAVCMALTLLRRTEHVVDRP